MMHNDPIGAAAEGTSKFTGPGRYEIVGYGSRRTVFLDPLPETHREYFRDWIVWSEDEETRGHQGNWWLALDLVEPLIVRKVEEC